MASDRAIAGVLAMLHELFPTREINDKTLDAWALVLGEWDDNELQSCAMACAREPGRTFFPTPGEICAHREIPTVDADAVLTRISGLGSHNPASGWLYPRVETVREALGDVVADAYVAAGGADCFASEGRDGSTVTRDIARRAFGRELAAAQKRHPNRPLLSAGGPNPTLLSTGDR